MCGEWLSYPVREFRDSWKESRDVQKCGNHRLSIVCRTRNLALTERFYVKKSSALSTILVPLAVSKRHNVLLEQHNTHIFAMFIMGTSPILMCHMPKQCRLLSPSCCWILGTYASWTACPLLPKPWPLKAHYIVFLHLCSGICPMPDNLNKCCTLASPVIHKAQNLPHGNSSQNWKHVKNRHFVTWSLTAEKCYSQYLSFFQRHFHERKHIFSEYYANSLNSFSMAEKRNVSMLFGPPCTSSRELQFSCRSFLMWGQQWGQRRSSKKAFFPI